jgi:hypothetical protein
LFWRSEHECVDREGFIRELGNLVMEARGQQLTLERWVYRIATSVAEPEPRAEEPKLNCLLVTEPKLRIAAPAPFYNLFIKDLQKFYRKQIMVAKEVF